MDLRKDNIVQSNLPPKVRLAIYLVTGIGGLVVTYLSVKNYIGDAEVTLWLGLTALVNGLAASNVNTNKEL